MTRVGALAHAICPRPLRSRVANVLLRAPVQSQRLAPHATAAHVVPCAARYPAPPSLVVNVIHRIPINLRRCQRFNLHDSCHGSRGVSRSDCCHGAVDLNDRPSPASEMHHVTYRHRRHVTNIDAAVLRVKSCDDYAESEIEGVGAKRPGVGEVLPDFDPDVERDSGPETGEELLTDADRQRAAEVYEAERLARGTDFPSWVAGEDAGPEEGA